MCYHLQAGPISLATTLGISVDFFSSGYLDVSVRRVRFAHLCIQCAIPLAGWVSPFGHLRIKASLPAPRSFSQACTSFFACNRQGIHHMHLFTWPYNCIDWQYNYNSTKCECCFYMSTTLGLFAVISSSTISFKRHCFSRILKYYLFLENYYFDAI